MLFISTIFVMVQKSFYLKPDILGTLLKIFQNMRRVLVDEFTLNMQVNVFKKLLDVF